MNLLEYIDKLEATARTAPQGNWAAPGGDGEIVSNEQPFDEGYGGKLIAESCNRLVAPHILATQPVATLALIAKLRDAIEIMAELARINRVLRGGLEHACGLVAPGDADVQTELASMANICAAIERRVAAFPAALEVAT